MTTLYANLTPADAGQVVEHLKAARVAYQVEDGGTRILVPAGAVHETRITLATAGLPQGGGVGFELFDRTHFGATDFVQKLNYQRALQGELARTIGQIREVLHARVHLALPQPSVFSDRDRPPTASVVLTLRPGARLAPEQVRGIVHLVSGSVEGLRADDVTVIDSAGRMHSQRTDRALGAGASSHLDYQAGVDAELQRRVQGMLDEVLGPGKASVRVSTQIEFSHGERTEERVDPNAVVRSEQRSSETTKGSATRPNGIVGTSANIGTPAGPTGTSGTSSESVKESESIQYEVGRIVEKRTLVAGEVKRLSVAVLVDPPYKMAAAPGGGEQKVSVPRDKAELDKIRAIVMRAVGFNASRGDEVEVVELAFDTSAVDRERVAAEREERSSFWWLIGKQAALVLGGGLLLLIGLRSLVALWRRAPMAGGRLDIREPAITAAEVEAQLAAKAAAALNPAQIIKGREREELQNRVVTIARENPAQVAQLIRSWMVAKKAS
jgi:flagellar M-ring protein FliF